MKSPVIAAIAVAALMISACGASHHSQLAEVANTIAASTTRTAATQPTHSSKQHSVSHRIRHRRTTVTVVPTTSTATTATVNPSKKTAAKPAPRHHATPPATATTPKSSTTEAGTATTPASITTKSGTVITVAGSPDATPTTPSSQVVKSPPTPTGVNPTGSDSPIPCLTAAGLNDAHLWQTGSWEATDASSMTYFVDGPFASHSAAETDANTLIPVAQVAVGGTYVVQTPLTNKATEPLLSVAACLAS